MPIIDFFSTPVWSKVTDTPDVINTEILELTQKLMKLNKEGVSQTNAGGWQSPFLSPEDIPNLIKFILSTFEDVKQDLNIAHNISINLNGCWINVNNKNSYNKTHTHSTSMLSGCYYVKIPKDSGNIVFEDPRPQTACLPIPVIEQNKYTTHTAKFHPTSGSIVIFPSWLPHSVEVNNNASDEERISVAFNMLFNEV